MSEVMNISALMKYRDIMKEKENEERSVSGETTKLSAYQSRIAQIDLLLDHYFIGTAEAIAPTIRIDLNLISVNELKAILPAFNVNNIKALQQTIDFKVADEAIEDATAEVVVDEKNELSDEDKALLTEVGEILRKKFVENIPNATKLYLNKKAKQLPEGVAWKELRSLIGSNQIIEKWENFLFNKTFEAGPIAPFFYIKKHLPTLSDIDIALILDVCVSNAYANKDKEKVEEVKKLLELGISGPKLYVTESNLDYIREYEKLTEEKDLQRRIGEILRINSPSERNKLLKRKEYVEMGY